VDNIKMDLRAIGWDGMDCIGLAEDRDQWRALMNAVMNLRFPYIKRWEVLEWLHNWQLLKKGTAPRVSVFNIILLVGNLLVHLLSTVTDEF
jgi:hypothetical protein